MKTTAKLAAFVAATLLGGTATAEPVDITLYGGSMTQDYQWTLTSSRGVLWEKYGIRLKDDLAPGTYGLTVEATLTAHRGQYTFTVEKGEPFTGRVRVSKPGK